MSNAYVFASAVLDDDELFQINKGQCRFLAQKLVECVAGLVDAELSRERAEAMPLTSELHHLNARNLDPDVPHMKENLTYSRAFEKYHLDTCIWQLDRISCRAVKLIEKFCTEDWLEAAIRSPVIEQDVVELLLDLQWWRILLDACCGEISKEQSRLPEVEATFQAAQDALWCPEKPETDGWIIHKEALDDWQQLKMKVFRALDGHQDGNGKDVSTDAIRLRLLAYLRYRISWEENPQLGYRLPGELFQPKIRRQTHQTSFGHVREVSWLDLHICIIIGTKSNKGQEAFPGDHVLHHPHIVKFMGRTCLADGEACVLTEYLPRDLYAEMNRHMERSHLEPKWIWPFKLPVAIGIMLQIAKAMLYIHKKGNIANVSLHPSNIYVKLDGLFEEEFHVILLRAQESVYTDDIDFDGSLLISPEARTGPLDISDREAADVWRFGVIFFGLISGTLKDLDLWNIDAMQPKLPQECPHHLRFCIMSCLKFDPLMRPTFSDLCKWLRHAKGLSLGLPTKMSTACFSYTPLAGPVVKYTNPGRMNRQLRCGFHDFMNIIFEVRISLAQSVKRLQDCVFLDKALNDMEAMLFNRLVDPCGPAAVELHYMMKEAQRTVKTCSRILRTPKFVGELSQAEIGEMLLNLHWWTGMVRFDAEWKAGDAISPSQIFMKILSVESLYADLIRHLAGSDIYNECPHFPKWEIRLSDVRELSSEERKILTADIKKEKVLELQNLALLKPPEFAINKEIDLNIDVIDIGSSGPILNYEDPRFALKVTTDSNFTRNGASLLLEDRHPHIVRLYYAWKEENRTFFSMELMTGNLRMLIDESLRSQGISSNPFSWLESVRILLQVAKAMRFVHIKRLAHGDLNCRNILWKQSRNNAHRHVRVKLGQFGAKLPTNDSRICSPLSDSLKKQSHPTVASSLDAMQASDVCSFGLVGFEVLTGHSPFQDPPGSDIEHLIQSGCKLHLDDTTTCPPYLVFCIQSCWNEDPRARPNFQQICLMLLHAQGLLLGLPFYKDQLESVFTYNSPDGIKWFQAQAPVFKGINASRPDPPISQLWPVLPFRRSISTSLGSFHLKLKAYLGVHERETEASPSSSPPARGLQLVEDLAQLHPDSAHCNILGKVRSNLQSPSPSLREQMQMVASSSGNSSDPTEESSSFLIHDTNNTRSSGAKGKSIANPSSCKALA